MLCVRIGGCEDEDEGLGRGWLFDVDGGEEYCCIGTVGSEYVPIIPAHFIPTLCCFDRDKEPPEQR